MLGFTRRLEVATLVFKDRLKQKVLLRASDPKAPATLLIELLRAYIPEEFSRNGHKCDTSKADELLRRFREDARRELEAGHPTLRKIAEGATNAPPSDDREPSYSNLSPAGGDPHNVNLSPAAGDPVPRYGAGITGQHPSNLSPAAGDPRNTNLSPAARDSHNTNLSPPGERYREGVPPAPSDESNCDNKERTKRKTPSP